MASSPRAFACDPASVGWSLLQIVLDHLVGLLAGVGQKAAHLLPRHVKPGIVSEPLEVLVAPLLLHATEVDGSPVDPGRGSRLEPLGLEPKTLEPLG